MMERSDKLDTVHRVIDFDAHIVVDEQACAACQTRDCLYFCPAGCFELDDEGGVAFHYEGCHECGTCRIACEKGIEAWRYPQGGRGVVFRLG